METLSEKNDAKNSARDGFGVEDGSEVVCLRCSKEFMFFQRRRGIDIVLFPKICCLRRETDYANTKLVIKLRI